MGFQITIPTDVPVAGDGSHDSPTWAEGGGPWSVPPQKTNGLVSEALASNLLNYEYQHDARWLRALRDRVALSDEGLLTTCVLSQGTWNLNGGTLDITLTPTRLVVDVNGDGGIVIEVKAPVGDPETLTASRDTYVDFDESGGYTLVAVPNMDPAPAVTAGHARVYKLVTDGTELTSAGLVQGVAPFPCFGPTTGIIEAFVTTANVTTLDVSGNATVTGTTMFTGDSTFTNDVTVGNELIVTAALTAGELAVTGASVFTGTVMCNGVVTVTDGLTIASSALLTFEAGATLAAANNTWVWGSSNVNDWTINGNVTLGTDGSSALTFNGAIDIGDNSITGIAGSFATVEHVQLLSTASPSTATGALSNGGRFLTFGLSATAKKVVIYDESYIAGPVNTVNAIDDTGASVTLTLATGDVVLVEASFETANTSSANNVNVNVTANGAIIGGSQAYRPVANSTVFAVCRHVQFTAPADNAYEFKIRHGASAGTTSSYNIHLKVRHRT